MPPVPHIAIIVDRGQPFESLGYCLAGAARIWQGANLEVEIYDEPAKAKDADIAILHVDQTIVSSEYLSLAARYPCCLNRYTSDISKRTISKQVIRRGDGFQGPVIVKANLNCGGALEATLPYRSGHGGSAPPVFSDYQVLESPDLVPENVWTDPTFVVEKFLPEREGDRYCVRLWTFLGTKGIVYRCQADEPVVKGSNTVVREVIDEVPEEIRQMREELGFDFGKFDFGFVDGKAVLYDANRTPTYGKTQTPEQRAARDRAIAEGIWEFLSADLTLSYRP